MSLFEIQAQTAVSGVIKYVWTSQGVEINQESSPIYLSAASEISWSPPIDLRTEPGKHVAHFEATWIPASDSYDAIFSNSKATGSVDVEAPLRLTWVESSVSLKDANQETHVGPLSEGEQYSFDFSIEYICHRFDRIIPVQITKRKCLKLFLLRQVMKMEMDKTR